MASSSGISGEKRRRPCPKDDDPFYTTNYIMIGPGKHFAITDGMDKEEMIRFFDDARRATRELIARHGDGRPADGVTRASILADSCHRDGSIYRNLNDGWHQQYCIADRNETRQEPMMESEPTDCRPDRDNCTEHVPAAMMQFFDLKLVNTSAVIGDDSPVQLYGYLAARDYLEPSRNFLFRRTRDDPLIIHQGSSIQMIGPKRGIDMRYGLIVEFDMKIKKGGEEEESQDLQLIDGAIYYTEIVASANHVITKRIEGDNGAVDISSALLRKAVEATIEVGISQIHHDSGLDLQLSCFASGLHEELHLFRGAISMSTTDPKRFVVAVVNGHLVHLKFRVGRTGMNDDVERYCSFKAAKHGCRNNQQIMLEFCTISVKICATNLMPDICATM